MLLKLNEALENFGHKLIQVSQIRPFHHAFAIHVFLLYLISLNFDRTFAAQKNVLFVNEPLSYVCMYVAIFGPWDDEEKTGLAASLNVTGEFWSQSYMYKILSNKRLNHFVIL